MKPAFLVVLVWSLTLLSGCHALDDDEDATGTPTPSPSPSPSPSPTDTGGPSPSPSPSPTDEPETVVTIQLLSYSKEVNVTEDIVVNWRVQTSPSVVITMSEVLWDDASFTAADTSNATSAGKTEDTPGEADFTAKITAQAAGTIYLLAHAVVEGNDHYTDVVNVTVKATGATGGTVHEVSIGQKTVKVSDTVSQKVGGSSNSFFEPDKITIKVGDSVVWKNTDGTTHSVKDCQTPSGADPCPATETPRWQTPNIPTGTSSPAIQFDTIGTFNYYCSVHASSATMGKTSASGYYVKVET